MARQDATSLDRHQFMCRLKAILTSKITMGHMGAATEQEMLAFDCSYINCRFIGKSRFKPCLGSTGILFKRVYDGGPTWCFSEAGLHVHW